MTCIERFEADQESCNDYWAPLYQQAQTEAERLAILANWKQCLDDAFQKFKDCLTGTGP